jgi:hypothetical protein
VRIRRTERDDDQVIEVFIEDWPREGESEEVFEERLLRFAERLVMLDTTQPAEEKGGDA